MSGSKGFGNARSLRKLFEQSILEGKDRWYGKDQTQKPRIELVDVIGREPAPENIPLLKEALDELSQLTGMARVKESIQNLVHIARDNWRKELRAESPQPLPLNRLFLGNPGTGKSTVAAIYGKVLRALRFLSKGDVISKTASDFVGDVVGASQQKTKAILEMAEGKVLLIDEAYGLDDNLYGKQVW